MILEAVFVVIVWGFLALHLYGLYREWKEHRQ